MEPVRPSKKAAYRLLAVGLIVLNAAVFAALARDSEEPKGELKIGGTHVARLGLERDDGHTENWTHLRGSVELPVGTYQVQQLRLYDDYSCQQRSLASLGPIVITEDEPAVLKAGGPLQQTVTITRQGRTLILGYGLQGIGGEQYTPRSAAQAEFSVYRGDTAIASGNFEYG